MTEDTLNTEVKKLDACIHCGMCLPTCPTYRVTGSEAESPRGRLYLMKAFLQGQLDSPQQLTTHLDPCLGCLACVTACPSGVEYGTLLMASREKLVNNQSPIKRAWRRLLLAKVLPKPQLLNILVWLTRLYVLLGFQAVVRYLGLAKLVGPLGKLEEFIPTLSPGKPVSYGARYGENRYGKVVLFVGCIMNAIYSQTHQATIEALVANGFEVIVPQQTCCGALAHHSGESDIARHLAQVNIDCILSTQPDWIVVNAAGCGSTLKEYHHILQNHPQSQAFADKVIDVLELLAKRPLEGLLHPIPIRATYHAACHLHHAQGIQQEPYTLLNQIPQLKLIPLTEADMCCGSAGVYNLAHPEMSLAILKEKMRHLQNTGADIVLAANPGCIMQLETGIRRLTLPMKVRHPIDLIAQAYRQPTTKENLSEELVSDKVVHLSNVKPTNF